MSILSVLFVSSLKISVLRNSIPDFEKRFDKFAYLNFLVLMKNIKEKYFELNLAGSETKIDQVCHALKNTDFSGGG